jgi:hypothetical protein
VWALLGREAKRNNKVAEIRSRGREDGRVGTGSDSDLTDEG